MERQGGDERDDNITVGGREEQRSRRRQQGKGGRWDGHGQGGGGVGKVNDDLVGPRI